MRNIRSLAAILAKILIFLPLISFAVSTSPTPAPNSSGANVYVPISSQTPRPPSQPATFSNALNAWAAQRRCLDVQRANHVRVTPATAAACKRPILTPVPVKK